MAPKFQAKKAVREKIYVKLALMAPSGGGKTYSALRLAKGMATKQEELTGKKSKILMASTEGSRGYYYASEFDYDIVDLEAPFNPELFIDVIQYAIDEGYDILLMDSTSPEWEGVGGCLELQQKAGGTYQAWGKVTPRHDAFIQKLATSPIHIIATMRGKDQYEIETDDRGKKSVKKLGVGAKQRDGFEYEFTCTFTIDQKSHTAEPQKDNTHIFDNMPPMSLTEAHGEKIMQWANESDVDIVKQKFEAAKAEEATSGNLEELKKEVITVATEVFKKDKEKALKIINELAGGNPNNISDIETANKVLEALKGI